MYCTPKNVLQELDTTWATMEFMMDEHPRTGITLIRTSEEMIETLEENQVGLLFSRPQQKVEICT